MDRYPHIQFRRHWKVEGEVYYSLGECAAIISAIREAPLRPQHHAKLLRVSLVKGAQATTAIEGNTLSEAEVGLVAAGESLPLSKEYQGIEVRNVLDAMNLLLREVAVDSETALITEDLIRRFHEMIGRGLGEHFDAIPGQYRMDDRVVGPYKCPDPGDVATLMRRLCAWLRTEFGFESGKQSFVDAVIQAVVSHVYLEWIHPFADGNGRTGRLLEFYVLLRAGNPDIASHILSNFYNETRPEYYRQLHRACETRDLTRFLAYAVQGLRDGLSAALAGIQESQFETAWRSFVYDKFAERKYRKNVFKRRRQLILDLPIGVPVKLEEIPFVSTRVAGAYSALSGRTLRRDLAELEEMGLVLADGNRFAARTDALQLHMPRRTRRGQTG
jgi:Fic family protein